MPALENTRWEKFCQAIVAEGLNAKEAYLAAGYEAADDSARISGSRLLTSVVIQSRIRELQERAANVAVMGAAFDRSERIARLEKRARELDQIIAERASDGELQAIPGGSTGHVWYTWKAAGRELCKEYGVDLGLLKELRAIEQQIAQEMGEWLVKTALDVRADLPTVDIPENASIDDIRAAKSKMLEAYQQLTGKAA